MNTFAQVPARDCCEFLGIPVGNKAVLFAVGGMLLFAAVTAGYVFLRSVNFSWGSLGALVANVLWISPAIAALGFVVVKVAPHFAAGVMNVTKPAEVPLPGIDEDVPAEATTVADWPRRAKNLDLEREPKITVELPDWTQTPVLRRDSSPEGSYRVVLSSEMETDWTTARRELVRKAAGVIRADFQQTHPNAGSWEPNLALVKDVAVVNEAVEKTTHESVERTFDMYKVYWQVELSPDVRKSLHQNWQESVVGVRVKLLGAFLGFLTLILATLATYFRLDARSNGQYRRRLKVAALSLVCAASVVFVEAVK